MKKEMLNIWKFDCGNCSKKGTCPHVDSFRRFPVEYGGAGACTGMVYDFESKNIYDLKNYLFMAVIDKNADMEAEVKKAIYKKLESVGNYMFNN